MTELKIIQIPDACDTELTAEHSIKDCSGPPCRRHFPEIPPWEAIELPPGPKCKRCGHEPCPICQTWCDVLECEGCGLDTDHTECDLDETELKKWLEEIEPLLEESRKRNIGVISSGR